MKISVIRTDALRQANRNSASCFISLGEKHKFGDHRMRYHVEFDIRSAESEEVEDVIEEIQRVASIADALNALEIECVYEDDPEITTSEAYEQAVTKLTEAFFEENVEAITDFLKKGEIK